MIHCSLEGCGKAWDAPGGIFPLCVTNPCPLRAVRDQMLSQSLQARGRSESGFFHTSAGSETMKGNCLVAADISNSLNSLRDSCSKTFKEYDMKGALSATTTVRLPNGEERSFRTTAQMHSEMVAIEFMLNQGFWVVYLGSIIWAHDHTAVLPNQFRTAQPHCGFCTLFLIAARLPIGTPTRGNYQLASRCAYQLPVELEVSPHFIARVLDSGCYCGFPALKRLLNAYVRVPASQWVLSIYSLAYVDDHTYVLPGGEGLLVVEWSDLAGMFNREIIYLAWKFIFHQLLLTNKGS